MFHVYDGQYRITSQPVTYNFLMKVLFQKVKTDWDKISTLPLGEHLSIDSYKVVRVA